MSGGEGLSPPSLYAYEFISRLASPHLRYISVHYSRQQNFIQGIRKLRCALQAAGVHGEPRRPHAQAGHVGPGQVARVVRQ